MKKYIIIVAIVLLLLTALAVVKILYMPFPRLNANSYSHVSITAPSFDVYNSANEEHIELVVNFINSTEATRALGRAEAQNSPFLWLVLTRNDREEERHIRLHGAAWTPDIYIIYNGVFYKIRDLDKFWENLDQLDAALNSN